MNSLLLAHGARISSMNLWYAVPAIIAVSLVYAATRHERMGPILVARRPRGPVAGRFHVRRLRRAGSCRLVYVECTPHAPREEIASRGA